MSLRLNQLQGYNSLRPGEKNLLNLLEGRISSQTLKAINEGRAIIHDDPDYIRSQIQGGSGQQYILNTETTDDFVRGVSTFKGNSIAKGRASVVTRMAIRHGVDVADPGPAISNPASIKYFNNSNSVPAYLLSGDMFIRVQGNQVFKSRFQRFFQVGAVYNCIPGMTDVVHLETPFGLVEDDEIEISYRLPEGATLTAPASGVANDFIEIEFFGPKVIVSN